MAVDSRQFLAAISAGDQVAAVDAARQILATVLEDPGLVEPNRHPVGFIHAKLDQQGPHAVRLHIWPVPSIPPQDPPWLIHRHAWKLESTVLFGSVVNRLYEVSPDPAASRRLYEVGYDDLESVMRQLDEPVDCCLSSEEMIREGQTYSVAESAFHSTHAPDDVAAATIAVTGEPSGSAPLVVGDVDGESEYRFARQPIDLGSFQTYLHAFRT
jgi:hypothetical protein